MKRKNCWEVKKCGRQPGGEKVDELGVCPAAVPNEYDGTNKGNHGGRFCWQLQALSVVENHKEHMLKSLWIVLSVSSSNRLMKRKAETFL